MTSIRRGFLLGKFLPPHAGHQYLCDFAVSYCDQLTILVCSIDSEPIPGEHRFSWMRSLYPNARVLHCHEDLPQQPSDHPDFWAIWRDVTRRYHPEPIDLVFASEPYGERLACETGARFVPVDLDRAAIPISGRAIRDDPLKHWSMIAAPARSWFTKVISLHGPECSGKTTLARQLAAHFGTVLVPEYGRTYTECFGTDCDNDALVRIARGQASSIEAGRNHARGLVISDTDPVLTAVWSDMLTGQRDPFFRSVRRSDFYILTDIDFEWSDDGTRYFQDSSSRERFFAASQVELETRNCPHVRVSGDEATRFRHAVEAIQTRYPDLVS